MKANQWEKTRGTATGKIVDMSAIFQLHEVCRLEILHSFLGVKANQWEKMRGTATGKIVDMSATFQLHEVCRNPRTVLHEGDPGTLYGKDNLLQQTCVRLGHKETRRRGLFLEIQTCAVAEMLRHQTSVIPFVRSFCLQMVKKKTKQSFFF